MIKTMGCAIAMGLLLLGGIAGRAHGATEHPNFVIIFADDLGYGDLGCYGAPKIKTPHLDQMATEGMRFTAFYSAAPVCTPSRAGLLTGRYPIHTGDTMVRFPFSKDGISADEDTLAEMLQREGYATACIGKWHLGHLPPFLPTRHGFDYYYGIPYSNDMDSEKRNDPPIPIYRNEEIVEQPANQHTLTKRYTEEAVAFIERSKDGPFFLYVPHSMPHIPIFASDDFRGTSEAGLYGDVIQEIDWSVGQILDALKARGLAENTLVLFTSDNGPWLVKKDHGGSAGPLRHGKGTTFEGGVREPAIAWWPGQVPAGVEQHHPAMTIDLAPTFAALAGATPQPKGALDGKDIRNLLFNKGARPSEDFFFYHNRELQAYRMGKWKLKRPFKGKVYGEPLEHGTLLFDLEQDPGEAHNLVDAHPDIAQRMEATMAAFDAAAKAE